MRGDMPLYWNARDEGIDCLFAFDPAREQPRLVLKSNRASEDLPEIWKDVRPVYDVTKPEFRGKFRRGRRPWRLPVVAQARDRRSRENLRRTIPMRSAWSGWVWMAASGHHSAPLRSAGGDPQAGEDRGIRRVSRGAGQSGPPGDQRSQPDRYLEGAVFRFVRVRIGTPLGGVSRAGAEISRRFCFMSRGTRSTRGSRRTAGKPDFLLGWILSYANFFI